MLMMSETRLTPTDWADPDDLGKFGKRARRIQGFRALSSIYRMFASGAVTLEMLAASNRFLRDYEVGVEGVRLCERVRVDGGSGPDGYGATQLDALRHWREALQALGPSAASIVVPVVLQNWTVADWARVKGVGAHQAMGRLLAGLDRLKEWYDSMEQGPCK